MPAYWVARAKITDPALYKRYTDRVPDIIDRYGGKVLARGGVMIERAHVKDHEAIMRNIVWATAIVAVAVVSALTARVEGVSAGGQTPVQPLEGIPRHEHST